MSQSAYLAFIVTSLYGQDRNHGATFVFKKTGESDTQKSQTSSRTDKASPDASGSEPPAQKSKGPTPQGFCDDWLKRFS